MRYGNRPKREIVSIKVRRKNQLKYEEKCSGGITGPPVTT